MSRLRLIAFLSVAVIAAIPLAARADQQPGAPGAPQNAPGQPAPPPKIKPSPKPPVVVVTPPKVSPVKPPKPPGVVVSPPLHVSPPAPPGHASPPIVWRNPSERDFRGRDVHRFSRTELSTWRRGHWFHGVRHGRFGWWWFAAGFWYFYPQPIYPYPDTVSDVAEPEDDTVLPADQAESPEDEDSGDSGQHYYFCAPLNAYYPSVRTCPSEWELVPITPDSR